MTLAALALALALPAAAQPAPGHHHDEGGTGATATPTPQQPANSQPGAPLTDEQFDQRIGVWKQDIRSSDYHPKVKERLIGEIDGVHNQYHDQTDHFRENDPRSQVRDSDVNQLKTVVRNDADLERYVWRVGRKHGLDPANNNQHLEQLRAAIGRLKENETDGSRIADAAGGVFFTKDERAELRRLAETYIGSMHELGHGSPAGGVLHNVWHQISTKVDPQGGGLPYVPRDQQSTHNEAYIKDQSKDPYPLVFTGNRDLLNGDPASALSKANAALALDPNNVQALDLAGASNYQLKNLSDAAGAARKALSLDPKDQTAQAILDFVGKGALGNGPNLDKAADGFGGRGPADSPDGVLGFARGTGGRLVASSEKGSPQAAMLTRDAMAALSLGDAAGALASLDKALAIDPANVRALNIRALALARLKRYDAALADADAALKLDPKNQLAMNTRAIVLNKLKRFEEAAEQARKAIEADPNDASAWRNLAEALAGLGDRAGSLAALKRAAELDARFQPLLEDALKLPSDADLNLLFADEGPSAGALRAARDAQRAPRNWRLLGAAAGLGTLLLLAGFWSELSRSAGERWKRFTRVKVVRAAEMRYLEAVIGGRYRLGSEMSSSGLGTVFDGEDVSLRRKVAIKRMPDELRADPRARARFIQETKAVAALRHENIVDVYAIVDEGPEVYVVFEYVNGSTVGDLIAAKGRLGLDEALRILRGVAAALEFAHGRGVLHRDLRPSNIMLDLDGRVKVLDFAVALAAKRPYMAPEQEKGSPRKESDVYSLALCLYQMLTGREAFSGTGAGMLMNKVDKAFAPVTTLAPELPSELDAVFADALEPDPAQRVSSPRELVARVEAAAARRA